MHGHGDASVAGVVETCRHLMDGNERYSMADNQTKLDWTRKYERLIREMLGYGKVNSVPGDREGRDHAHEGIDVGRPFRSSLPIEGAELRAPAAGTVVRTGPIGGFGNAVVLERDHHGRRVTEIFGHLQDGTIPASLQPGAQVHFSDVVGRVGATGGNYTPHLHYETYMAPDMESEKTSPRPAAVGRLWPDGKPPTVDPYEVQNLSDLSRYTFGIDDPRVRQAVEAHIRKKYGQRRTGDVSGEGQEFDRQVRTDALRKAATMMPLDRLAELSDEDFAWATHSDYWRMIMDPSFNPR